MTAEPIDEHHAPWQPDPMRQQAASYTIEDLLSLPPDAPRVELIDGVILVAPSPTEPHQDITGLVWLWLRTHAPREYKAVLGLGVVINERYTREPDVILRTATVENTGHFITADRVALAVEVVSLGTRRTDRFTKPADYAAAGIRYYWRIEQDPVQVFAYRLTDRPGPSGLREYELVADSTDELELTEPFPIKLPISEITP
jgi:Uma2 family endonuclease